MEGQLHEMQVSEEEAIAHPLKQHCDTLIWMHGLGQGCQVYYRDVVRALGQHAATTRIVMPQAPQRHVTVLNTSDTSWFDIKFRSEKSFIVPFEEAFSGKEVHDSFERIILPLILRERGMLKEGGRLIVSGFSQGCAMSLHALYCASDSIDGVVSIGGYLFAITPFRADVAVEYYVIHGLADDLRPWQAVKLTHEGKTPQEKITLIPGMKHEINEDTVRVMAEKYHSILTKNRSKL